VLLLTPANKRRIVANARQATHVFATVIFVRRSKTSTSITAITITAGTVC